jgi:pPIWI RE three-gene island domain Z
LKRRAGYGHIRSEGLLSVKKNKKNADQRKKITFWGVNLCIGHHKKTIMNLTQRPQPTTAPAAQPARRASRFAQLSARQLFDVELGLCLLAKLSPSASPAALPALLTNGNVPETARQRRCLDKARFMLANFAQPRTWADLLDRYTRLPNDTQAFDISHDHSRFSPKTVGFFRNRVRTLNQLLA